MSIYRVTVCSWLHVPGYRQFTVPPFYRHVTMNPCHRPHRPTVPHASNMRQLCRRATWCATVTPQCHLTTRCATEPPPCHLATWCATETPPCHSAALQPPYRQNKSAYFHTPTHLTAVNHTSVPLDIV